MSYLCPHPCDGKTEYGYCRYTWCINPLHSNLGTAQQGQGVQRAVITNADRIRAMTDEELAEFLTAVAKKSAAELCESLLTVDVDLSECDFGLLTKTHLDWLRQETAP